MGLVFTAIEPEQRGILETWLAESRETSWLAANRRRSQRVLMTIPVRLSGSTGAGSPFEEKTHTRAISAHGALILVSAQVYRGQRLTLSNLQTKAALECVVAHIDKQQNDHPQVGVEFTLPNPMFWHVAFPPKDWTPRHADAEIQSVGKPTTSMAPTGLYAEAEPLGPDPQETPPRIPAPCSSFLVPFRRRHLHLPKRRPRRHHRPNSPSRLPNLRSQKIS